MIFEAAFKISCFVRQPSGICVLIPILSHQTGPPAAYCLQHGRFPGEPRCVFLLLRIRQAEFFWSMLSLT